MEISTIDLNQRSGVSAHQKGGVSYTPAPSLDEAAKKRAREKSRELMRQGIIGERMGAYTEPTKNWKILYKC